MEQAGPKARRAGDAVLSPTTVLLAGFAIAGAVIAVASNAMLYVAIRQGAAERRAATAERADLLDRHGELVGSIHQYQVAVNQPGPTAAIPPRAEPGDPLDGVDEPIDVVFDPSVGLDDLQITYDRG